MYFYSFLKIICGRNKNSKENLVKNFCSYIMGDFTFYMINGKNKYPMVEKYTFLIRYIKEYKNILSENTIESIGFKFLLEGKENYFYKLYNIVVSGENIDFVGFYDIVLNLLYSKNAPCGVFNNNNEGFPESKLLDIISVFINKSTNLIIKRHSKNNSSIEILNIFYRFNSYNGVDFIVFYIFFINNHRKITIGILLNLSAILFI